MYDAYDSMQLTGEPTGVGGNKYAMNERARGTDGGNGDALRASLRVDLARCVTLMSKPAAAKCRGYGQLMGGPISA